MKNLILYLAGLFIILTFNTCDLIDDSPCGVHDTQDIYLLGSSVVDSTNGVYYSYMDNNNRVFQYSKIIEGICTEEHVTSEFRVALLDENTTGIYARGKVSYQFLYENTIPMSKNKDELRGNGSTGLKMAFDGMEGWCVPTVEIYFPTKGSYSLDTAFLKANVISVENMTKYRKF